MRLKELLKELNKINFTKEADIGKIYVINCGLCDFRYGRLYEHTRKARRMGVPCLRYEGKHRSKHIIQIIKEHMKSEHTFEYSVMTHKTKGLNTSITNKYVRKVK